MDVLPVRRQKGCLMESIACQEAIALSVAFREAGSVDDGISCQEAWYRLRRFVRGAGDSADSRLVRRQKCCLVEGVVLLANRSGETDNNNIT